MPDNAQQETAQTDWTPERLKAQGYRPATEDRPRSMLDIPSVRAREDMLLGRFSGPRFRTDEQAERAAHEDALRTARARAERQERFLQACRDAPKVAARLTMEAALDQDEQE